MYVDVINISFYYNDIVPFFRANSFALGVWDWLYSILLAIAFIACHRSIYGCLMCKKLNLLTVPFQTFFFFKNSIHICYISQTAFGQSQPSRIM